MNGTQYCFSHNPAAAAAKKSAVTKGGRNRYSRVTARTPEKPCSAKSVDELPSLLFRTLCDLRNGNLDAGVARSIGYLAGVVTRVVETVELSQRVQSIEDQLDVVAEKFEDVR